MSRSVERRALSRLVWTGLLALVLIGAPPAARADDAPPADDGGGNTVLSWDKFFDYAGCAVGIIATVETGGLAWAPTMLICARALALHMSD